MKYRNIILVAVASRVVVLALGCVLPYVHFVPKINEPISAMTESGVPRLIEPWFRWDGAWYSKISREAYSDFGQPGHTSLAFMPLQPVIMALGADLGLNRYWVGLIVPNVAFVVGLYFFARIVFLLTGREASVWRSSLLLIAYPWSFYFSAPYQESLGLALLAGGSLAWVTGRPWAAAGAGALSTTARLSALAFPASIIGEWIVDKVRGRPTRPYAWPVALACSLGLLTFLVYCQVRFGDALAHVHAHAAWGRKPPGLLNVVEALIHVPRGMNVLKDYVAAILFLGLGLISLRMRGVFWAGLVLIPIVQVLSSGTVMSTTRVTLMCFPAFLEAGELLRNRYACGAVVVVSAILQVLMIKGFVT